MTSAIESEWREWYRQAYGCEPTYGPPFGANPAASLAAWTAAAQRRDELTKLPEPEPTDA